MILNNLFYAIINREGGDKMKKKSIILVIAILLIGVITTGCDKSTKNTSPDGYDYLVLVNKYSKLPDNWEKKVQLVDAKNAWDEDIKVEKRAYEQYKKLAKDLKEEGITIELDSVYRSVILSIILDLLLIFA